MLSLRQISSGYNGNNVIHDIDVNIKKGENLCILGPNGCGKTTLLKTMAKIIPYSSGNLLLEGKELKEMPRKAIARKIAMLSQHSGYYFSYSVYATVMMGRYLYQKNGIFSSTSDKDHEVVLQCLKAVGLLDHRDKNIASLSGGQLQRVFLARTLAQEPQIILLDEPTNHLDLKYQVELIEYLKEWSIEGNRNIIGVLHDINLAIRLSDHIMLMKDGKLFCKGKKENVLSKENLQYIYDIDVVRYMCQSYQNWILI